MISRMFPQGREHRKQEIKFEKLQLLLCQNMPYCLDEHDMLLRLQQSIRCLGKGFDTSDHIRGPYANVNTTYDRYLDSRNGRAGNNSDVQEEEEQHNKGQCDLFDNPTQKPASLQVWMIGKLTVMGMPTVVIKSLLDVVRITAAHVYVNAAQLDLVLLVDFKENMMIDNALWEVIENGETLAKTKIIKGVMAEMPITTAEEKAQRRLEVLRKLIGQLSKRDSGRNLQSYKKDLKEILS
ncbi:hypothetical protein Tco_0080547 [Tanacetum coccineum]